MPGEPAQCRPPTAVQGVAEQTQSPGAGDAARGWVTRGNPGGVLITRCTSGENRPVWGVPRLQYRLELTPGEG